MVLWDFVTLAKLALQHYIILNKVIHKLLDKTTHSINVSNNNYTMQNSINRCFLLLLKIKSNKKKKKIYQLCREDRPWVWVSQGYTPWSRDPQRLACICRWIPGQAVAGLSRSFRHSLHLTPPAGSSRNPPFFRRATFRFLMYLYNIYSVGKVKDALIGQCLDR